MKFSPLRRALVGTASVAAVALALTGCSGFGSTGSNTGSKVTITFLTQNDAADTAQAKALITGFEKKYPDVTVKLNTQPAGTQGDNLMKTKLSTKTMNDVFHYNSGSLFQALNPKTTMTDLSDQSWVNDLDKNFKEVVTAGGKVYGAPLGTSSAGGILYNKKIYQQLGLSVPTTWDEFIANGKKIQSADPSVTPVLQSFGDTWTSQLLVLGDFANINKQDPNWADNYTNNKGDAKYVNAPAFEGFQHTSEIVADGLVNKDYASMTNAQAMDALATGKAAQYPMLTSSMATVQQNEPNDMNDVGVFAIPSPDAKYTSLTLWEPNALYIPSTTKGDKLQAAKNFVAFANSSDGCTIQNQTGAAAGPYATSVCKLPSDAPDFIKDVQKYIDDDQASPALEFKSPIKGPNLETILVGVGSGTTTAQVGAQQYDQDVKAQAQQLGIKGW
ncbi:carbohydrate ABC transporter substrate-binding protein [Planctomonas sp. JC2975]|uniref:ABC transporter substrate-binding protein n=1 Tax=Planctomonas sp. JC2975 TaxID=2729626 RepID=UPI00147613BB|nr:ABC transporter substrate-binding protein [Planctomonas sp. JC2975]NNC12783.1 carbohydrate ABC transporter substrate-binding protein [Planctomonas sp. JC2975]